MPLYHFDFRDAEGLLHPDNEGVDFANLAAAKREAAKTLGAITGEDGVIGASFEIRDERNDLICVVKTTSEDC